jgi:NTE family protein
METGREVWFTEGPSYAAVRASAGIPGVMSPVRLDGRWLLDGGLVNPVPVSLCRALGADIVIAVDLNWDLIKRRNRISSHDYDTGKSAEDAGRGSMLDAILAKFRPADAHKKGGAAALDMPSMLDVLTASLNIMQMRITQSRLAGEPADVVIRPRLFDVAPMDYHLAASTIAEGERAADYALPQIRDVLA